MHFCIKLYTFVIKLIVVV